VIRICSWITALQTIVYYKVLVFVTIFSIHVWYGVCVSLPTGNIQHMQVCVCVSPESYIDKSITPERWLPLKNVQDSSEPGGCVVAAY
jgi:hypothetical protein